MQIQKDEVREAIITAAKINFMKYGFQKASLREIAQAAGVTKGNIYTYFRNKDLLFCEIVKPAMSFLRSSMGETHEQSYILMLIENTVESAAISRKDFADFVSSLSVYEEALKLLFFASAGSGMENFREEIFELYTRSTVDFNRRITEMMPGKNIKMSEMLIHTLASMYLRLIEEILIHEPDSRELDEYVEQMATLVHHGFASVIKLQL